MNGPDEDGACAPPVPDLREVLAARLHGTTVVVGIGNPRRGDDAAGSLVARSLLRSSAGGMDGTLRIIDAEDVPEAYLGPMTRPPPDSVVLVDAVNLGAAPGTTALLETEEVAGREVTTHSAPLTLLARYVREETGADVFLLGIQPRQRGVGASPSPEVRQAAAAVALLLETAVTDRKVGARPEPRKALASRDGDEEFRWLEGRGWAGREGRPC